MWSVDWETLFEPGGSLLELAIRGSVLYLFLFTLLRILPRRQVGTLGVSDVLVIVLLADAAQNGLAGEYRSITEAAVLVTTILAWDFAIDWLDRRFPALHLAASGPLLLVRNGRLLAGNLEREQLTREELMSKLRQHGVENLAAVKRAYVEGDGHISVIRRERKAGGGGQEGAESSPRAR